MANIKNWIDSKLFWLKTGNRLRFINDGEAVDEVVIQYKDYYLSIMTDIKTGDPTGDFYWTKDPMMFHIPMREWLIAKEKEKR